jgi:hypothetical protein
LLSLEEFEAFESPMLHFFVVVSNSLSLTSAHHQSQLGSLVPKLGHSFCLMVKNILLHNFSLYSDCLQELGHLFETSQVLAQFLDSDYIKGSDLLLLDYRTTVGIMSCDSVVKVFMSYSKLALSPVSATCTPSREDKSSVISMYYAEEVSANSFGVVFKPVLTCNESNSLEHFDSESAAGNSTDNVACILLLADILTPCSKDVSLLLDIRIILSPREVSLKCNL